MPIQFIRSIIISFLFFFPAIAFAESPGSSGLSSGVDVAIALRYGSPIGDQINGGPKWSDAYNNSIGGSIEVAKRLVSFLALHGGISYDSFSAKEITLFVPSGVNEIRTGKFSDLNPLSIYVGGKGYFLGGHFERSSGIVDPYLRADLVMTSFNSIDFNSNSGTVSVGTSQTGFSYAFGLGVDIWASSSLAVLAEIKIQDYGKPGGAQYPLKALPELALGVRCAL
jgi:hypothetical protein